MKKIISIPILCLTLLFACQKSFDVHPEGKATQKRIDFNKESFFKIKATDHLNVTLIPSEENYIEIETDAEYQKYIVAQILGNTLDIRRANSAKTSELLPVNIIVHYEKLSIISAYKKSTIQTEGSINTEHLLLDIQAESKFNSKLDCTDVEIYIDQKSSSVLTGSTSTIKGTVKDNSSINIEELQYDKAEIVNE